ncbi:replication-relaxation family protein [Allosalinactinospora lopnorensis]|uniref:replication-relaxation family protein n=1 Tax=Allosalinactinospora lopnorensis TaxID=1352348 RepID=UPI0009E65AFA|nr:replication-relaxation family protein [Allosalinactinospora lopnorensis]
MTTRPTDEAAELASATQAQTGADLALSPAAAHVLHLLYHHRLLKTRHVHEMATPHAKWTRQVLFVLNQLHQAGLAGRVNFRGTRKDSLWYATPDGAAVVELSGDIPGRAYRMDRQRASGPLRHHALAVVDTGLAFLRHGRRRGDDVDPFDWSPEIAHRIRSGNGPFETTHLVSDALLHYLLVDAKRKQRAQMQFFLEVDRATMPLPRLAAKVTAYASYYDYVPEPTKASHSRRRGSPRPAWRMRYNRFPRVLIILTGARPQRLEHRRLDLAARLQENPYLASERSGFQVGATTLEQLEEYGPTAEIFLPLLAPHLATPTSRSHPRHEDAAGSAVRRTALPEVEAIAARGRLSQASPALPFQGHGCRSRIL